jgi:hypothetical protein
MNIVKGIPPPLLAGFFRPTKLRARVTCSYEEGTARAHTADHPS